LEDQALGQLNERQTRYAGLIHQSGRHLMTVVNDILDLTRMEGQMKLTLEPVQMKRFAITRSSKQGYSAQYQPAFYARKPLLEHPCDRFTL